MPQGLARCGLIGHPVAHSRSPELHRAFGEQTGIALDYELLDAAPEEFAATVKTFFASGGLGLNVTVPHKAAAFALADEAGEAARQSGVANTLTQLADGRIRADNTDGIGLVRDLENNHGIRLKHSRVLVIGAGGAAAGIVPALLAAGVDELLIANRTASRATALATRFGDARLHAVALTALPQAGVFDLVLNATSASLNGHRPELPESAIGPGTLAHDLVYADEATPFMTWAASLGARTADGSGMLVEQAAESFYLWHKLRPATGQS